MTARSNPLLPRRYTCAADDERQPRHHVDPRLAELSLIRTQRADLAAIGSARAADAVAAARSDCADARATLLRERARNESFTRETMAAARSAKLSRRDLERIRAALAASGQRVADALQARRQRIDELREMRRQQREALLASRAAERGRQKLEALLEPQRST